MSTKRFCLVLFFAVASLLPCLTVCAQPAAKERPRPAAKPPAIPDNVVLERDIEYGKAGSVSLLLDVLYPKQPSDKPRPVIAYIHGGGWLGGNKAGGIGSVLPYVASGNYVGVSIEYRFSNVAVWPAQINDCKAAIRWIKANAKNYNLDPDKIGVWGGSAGGHLVSMLGVSAAAKELEGDCGTPGLSSSVACVVDYCGPSDFPGIARLKEKNGRGAYSPCCKLIGGPIEEKTDAAKSVSPVTYVSKNAAPFLIVHGTADNVVPVEQAEVLHAALQKAGVSSTFIKMVNGGHGFGGPELSKRVQNFFEKHLRGQNVEVCGDPIEVLPPPAKK